MFAVARDETRSSAGSACRCSARPVTSAARSPPAVRIWVSASFMSSLMNSGSAPDKMMLVLRSTISKCSSPMPIISQMILSGSRADTCCTKSHGPVASSSSTMTPAVRCTSSSNFLIIFGVNARETIRRSRACRGSSMLIIEPKYSLNSTGRS